MRMCEYKVFTLATKNVKDFVGMQKQTKADENLYSVFQSLGKI